MQFEPEAILPIDRFIKAFTAKLVQQGWKTLSLSHTQTARGLSSVIQIFDDAIETFKASDVAWKKIVPWVRIANGLRQSPGGGIEGWVHHLKSAQGYLVRFSLTYPGIVELAMSNAAAGVELNKLTVAQLKLVDYTVQRFDIESRALGIHP